MGSSTMHDLCKKRNYNPFVIRLLGNGGIECVSAYSWRLSYLHMFGEYPKD